MYQPLTTIQKATSLSAGISKWWYTPIDGIAVFPAINPVTQMLVNQPMLKAGKVWYGPIKVAAKRVGYKQQQDKTKAGLFYKHILEAAQPGLDASALINLENLAHYQLCIVAKLRATGAFIIIGNAITGCQLDDEATTGAAMPDTPQSKLVFTFESIDKAPILLTFNP